MKKILIEILQKTKNQRININNIDDELKKRRINIHSNSEKTDQFITNIKELIDENILVPLKNATPLQQYGRLPNNYRIRRNSIDDNFSPISTEYREELLSLTLPIKIDYYLEHADQYAKDRKFILRIDELLRQIDFPELTANERSYIIFSDEKAIAMPTEAAVDGNQVLKNLKISLEDIKARKIFEPFFFIEHHYYSINEHTQRTVLIVENKDTFWTLQNAIKSGELDGVNLLIYGEGYAIVKKFEYIEMIGGSQSDRYYYFGDLDPEGIFIYNSLVKKYPLYKIKPAVALYNYIIIKAGPDKAQPLRKVQNRSETSLLPFIDCFEPETRDIITKMMEERKYIPQEVFNKTDIQELKACGIY